MSSVIGINARSTRRALLLAALLALGAPALAQTPAASPARPATAGGQPAVAVGVDARRLALAREYVRESHIDDGVRGMFASMARSAPQLTQDGAADARARQYESSFAVGMDAALPMLMDGTAEAVARAFTTQELKDMVAFYGSPTGQSLMAKLPTLTRQLAPMAYQILPKVYETAEADYCRHTTCTQADHTRFQRLETSMREGPPRQPPEPQ